jgi:threonine synthase
VAVDGNYDDVNRLCSELADRYRWAFANINVRPYYAEGSKTLAYEVTEQLGWRIPDRVVVPIASGSMFTKIWKGFNELVKIDLAEGMGPRMVGAQALGCSPVVTAYDAQTFNVVPVKPSTIAKSLAIGNPADGYYALKVIQESGGCAVSVDDEEIVDGIKLLARTEGIFAETAGGVSVGVLKKLADRGVVDPDELVVVYVTGNGLKTPEAVAERVIQPLYIKPTMSAFEEAMAQREGVAAGVA